MAGDKKKPLQAPVSAFSLAGEDIPASTVIVEPWAVSGSLTLLYAPRGEGKSYFCNFLAHAIACGTDFLGNKARPSRVIYFDGEMGPRQVSKRISIQAVRDYPKEMNTNLAFFTFADAHKGVMLNLAHPNDQLEYLRIVEKFDVIIIDNLLTCSMPMDSRDDDVRIWKRIESLLITLREKNKCIILVHHTAKAGQQYGTILKENLSDTIIAVRRADYMPNEDDLFLEIRFEKNRNHFKGCQKAYLARLGFENNGFTTTKLDLDEYRKAELFRLKRMGLSIKDAAEKLRISQIDAKILTIEKEEPANYDEFDDLI